MEEIILSNTFKCSSLHCFCLQNSPKFQCSKYSVCKCPKILVFKCRTAQEFGHEKNDRKKSTKNRREQNRSCECWYGDEGCYFFVNRIIWLQRNVKLSSRMQMYGTFGLLFTECDPLPPGYTQYHRNLAHSNLLQHKKVIQIWLWGKFWRWWLRNDWFPKGNLTK